jgi:hypothetical protein
MRTSDESGSPVLPDYKESRAGPALASSPPLPPPSLPTPTNRYSLRRPQSVFLEQSNKTMLTALSRQSMSNTSSRSAPRKPVIYLYPPSSLPDVTIELQLTSSWHFSAVYPLPQTAIPSYGHQPTQSLTWAISAEPDGTLVEKTTSTECRTCTGKRCKLILTPFDVRAVNDLFFIFFIPLRPGFLARTRISSRLMPLAQPRL